MIEEEEEEEVALTPTLSEYMAESRGRQARGSHAAYEPDNFGGAFRGVPTPHRGSQYVQPGQIIGDETHCWCGELLNHDWPGKEQGRKHPKEENMAGTVSQVLSRTNLKAYSRPIQDFVLMAVEKDALKYTIRHNSVMLYPPDGTTPISVYARNNDRQLQALESWYRKHVIPSRDAGLSDPVVEQHVVEKLAEQINDPVEHPKREAVEAAKREAVEAVDVAREQVTTPTEETWVPFINSKGVPNPDWEMTEGEEERRYRCLICLAEGKSHIRDTSRGMGGHKQGVHSSMSSVRNPETLAKAASTRRLRIDAAKAILENAIVINQSLGLSIPTGDSQKVERLEEENRSLRAKIGELQAKLDLMREALTA